VWLAGAEIEVEGSFGYLENAETPVLIQRLCRIIAVKLLKKEIDSAGVISEKIGDYSYTKGENRSAWLGSAEATNIISIYKRWTVGVV